MRALTLIAACLSFPAIAMSAEYPIAGVTPNQRPANAPVVQTVQKGAEWDAKFLYGILQPVPASILSEAKDQGNWYTPFNRPGMPGPYDIRGWYQANKAKKT